MFFVIFFFYLYFFIFTLFYINWLLIKFSHQKSQIIKHFSFYLTDKQQQNILPKKKDQNIYFNKKIIYHHQQPITYLSNWSKTKPMSDHESSPEPLELIDMKNVQPQPLPLPQYELVDDCKIGNFLRDRPDDLVNSFHFSHQEPNANCDDLNFYSRPQQHKHHQHYSHNQPSDHSEYYNNQANNQSQNQPQYQNHQPASQPSQQKVKPNRKCICKKTQCLKMYCECFASNLPCTQLCACIECKNTLQYKKQIIEIRQMIQEKGIVGLHSCSLSEKRCNCKKSNCLKKYCECYNSGVKCSQACKCESCKNCDKQENDESQNENQKVKKVAKATKVKKQRKNAKVEVKN